MSVSFVFVLFSLTLTERIFKKREAVDWLVIVDVPPSPPHIPPGVYPWPTTTFPVCHTIFSVLSHTFFFFVPTTKNTCISTHAFALKLSKYVRVPEHIFCLSSLAFHKKRKREKRGKSCSAVATEVNFVSSQVCVLIIFSFLFFLRSFFFLTWGVHNVHCVFLRSFTLAGKALCCFPLFFFLLSFSFVTLGNLA